MMIKGIILVIYVLASLVVTDSIQTMICKSPGPLAPGGVTQVKEVGGGGIS
jgi:predicted ATP-dependent serine protease